MDWFTNLGVYTNMFPGAPALAADMAFNPALDAERNGFYLAYHLQNAPEEFEAYQSFGPFGG